MSLLIDFKASRFEGLNTLLILKLKSCSRTETYLAQGCARFEDEYNEKCSVETVFFFIFDLLRY